MVLLYIGWARDSTGIMENKPILAFDCAGNGGSVSLCVAGECKTIALEPLQQASQLIPAIEEVLEEFHLQYADLAQIVTTIGPGSFTGLRVGLAALHGLIHVHHTPIALISTLEALAWGIKLPSYTIAVVAGKGELYTQDFGQKSKAPVPLNDIRLVPEDFNAWQYPVFGNHLATTHPNYLPRVDTALLCRIAEQLTLRTLHDAMPLYVRPPDAKIPQPLAWLATSGT